MKKQQELFPEKVSSFDDDYFKLLVEQGDHQQAYDYAGQHRPAWMALYSLLSEAFLDPAKVEYPLSSGGESVYAHVVVNGFDIRLVEWDFDGEVILSIYKGGQTFCFRPVWVWNGGTQWSIESLKKGLLGYLCDNHLQIEELLKS